MGAVAEIGALLRNGLTAWRDISLADVLFGHRDTTILALIVLVGLAAGVAVLRVAFGRRPGRAQVGLPALMSWARSSPWASVRHGAVLLSLAGVPFFMLALADPLHAPPAGGGVVSRPPHRPADRRVGQHGDSVSGVATECRRARTRRVFSPPSAPPKRSSASG